MGEDYVSNLVETTRKGVADGTIPAFPDKELLLEHLTHITHDKPA